MVIVKMGATQVLIVTKTIQQLLTQHLYPSVLHLPATGSNDINLFGGLLELMWLGGSWIFY